MFSNPACQRVAAATYQGRFRVRTGNSDIMTRPCGPFLDLHETEDLAGEWGPKCVLN